MPSRDFKPPEERTSPVPFFILGIVMVAFTFWTVWDETFTRRPWKSYQKQFNTYEQALVEKLLSEVHKESGGKIAGLDKRIAELTQKLNGDPELQRMFQELDRQKIDTFEKVQEFGFAKAVYDQSFFEYQEAIRQGRDTTRERRDVEAHRKELQRLQPIAEKAEAALAEIEAKIAAGRRPLVEAERERREAAKDLADLERRLSSIRARTYEVKQAVYREYDRNSFNEPVMRVDRCQTCHLAIDRAGFEKAPQPFRSHPHPELYLGKHDPEKVGCTSCHGGQGSAITSVEKAHGHVTFWEDPLLKGPEVQTKCRTCHAQVTNIPEAPHVSRGISLVRELGCFGCHTIPGTQDIRKAGPDLSRIQEKVYPGWLPGWIKRPRDYNARTKMPFFSLEDQEAFDIATFIWGTGQWKEPSQKPEGLNDPALIQQGKELFESVGCLGCHVRDDEDRKAGKPIEGVSGRPIVFRNRDFAPALGKIAQKVQPDWLVRWLKNPQNYWHETTMPSLRLSDQEANAVAGYLLSLSSPDPKVVSARLGDQAAYERGKKLVAKRGCFGCHDIPGTEKLSKIGPDLSSFARKKNFELSFGNVVDIPKTWEAWTFAKLKNPKIYQTEREELLMPNFDLSDQEVTAIRTLLRSMDRHGAPHFATPAMNEREKRVEAGRRMMEKYNCIGCHVVENASGSGVLLGRYEDPGQGPPLLNGEGAKVQPDWFYKFLRNVVTLRPWLKVRMPSFSLPDPDAAALVDYFAALDNKMQPYVHFDRSAVTPQVAAAGKDLFQKAECLSCHGEFPPPQGQEPPTAPNLRFAKERLRPDWIIDWIRNPGRLQPGTKMPVFFPNAGLKLAIRQGTQGERDGDRWTYALEAGADVELQENQIVSLNIGGQSHVAKVKGVEGRKVTLTGLPDLGRTIGKAEVENHGDPIDPEVLGGDAYKQIQALRDYLMIEEKFAPPAKGGAPRAEGPSRPRS
ncbi:MAG: c-type cytochrome [Candidatus Tectomicrobia bacterium]|uniref:C-type cytochrome n=1 Tax=Tectimicrobiota bacterium TaxID=2528274 RepID=A0A932HZJ5_UNCTE|nr:c-type cytochrome [Candidatus Tectomicrobia bacterium]